MKKIHLVLIMGLISSMISSCNKKSSESIMNTYNDEILKVYNYESNRDRNTELIDSSVFNELDRVIADKESKGIPQKIDITSNIEFNAFVTELGTEMADKYYSDNYGENTDVPDEELQSEIDYANELEAEMANAQPKIDELKEKISSIPKLREILTYNEFITEIHNMGEMYLSLPNDSARYKVSNREDLEYELKLLGGDLNNNFNLEEQLETKDILSINDNPLEIAASQNSNNLTNDESVEETEGDINETTEIEETNELDEDTSDSVEETVLDNSSIENELESIKDGGIINAEAYNEATQSEVDLIMESDFGEFKGFVTNGHYGFDEKAPESWYDVIINDSKNRKVTFDRDKLIQHIASVSDKLEYESGHIYIDKSNLDFNIGGCSIEIMSGIRLVITATIYNNGTYERINDAIYWDNKSFLVRSKQDDSTLTTTMSGYIDKSGVAHITSGLDQLIKTDSYNVHIVY